MAKKPRLPRVKSAAPDALSPPEAICRLRLFVARPTPSSARAEANLAAALVASENSAVFTIEIVDVLQNPQQAVKDRIIVTPCLLVVDTHPPLTIVGDLNDTRAVIRFLQRAKDGVNAG